MSGYEDYTRTSELYDQTRRPLGAEIILGCISRQGRRLDELVLVDAGCGTGNYALEFAARVGRVEAVDLNPGMLAKAASKLADHIAQGRVRVQRGSVNALPLESDSADALMMNQVLHHLNDDPASGWPAVRSVIAEFFRVLRPGGVAVINICSHPQVTRAWWYFSLIPEAVERMRARHIPLEQLEGIMAEAGFVHQGRYVPVDALMQGSGYLDPLALLDPDWRAGDSIWALVTEAELQRALSQIRAMEKSAALAEFVEQHDAVRKDIGQFTFISARKPPE